MNSRVVRLLSAAILICGVAITGAPKSSATAAENRGVFDPEAPPCILGDGKVARPPAQTGFHIGDTQFTAADVGSVEQAFDQFDGRPTILIGFSASGTAQLFRITRSNVGNVLPIFVDGYLLACPVVSEPISGGNMQVSGNWTHESAALAISRILAAVGRPG